MTPMTPMTPKNPQPSDSIKRYSHSKGYESIPRDLLQDPHLTLEAIGLLCNLTSYPPNWVLYKTELRQRFQHNSKQVIDRIWDELVANNYIVQFRQRQGKRYTYRYYFNTTRFTYEELTALLEDNARDGYSLYHKRMADEGFKPKDVWDYLFLNPEGHGRGSKNPPTYSTSENGNPKLDIPTSASDYQPPILDIPKTGGNKLSIKKLDKERLSKESLNKKKLNKERLDRDISHIKPLKTPTDQTDDDTINKNNENPINSTTPDPQSYLAQAQESHQQHLKLMADRDSIKSQYTQKISQLILKILKDNHYLTALSEPIAITTAKRITNEPYDVHAMDIRRAVENQINWQTSEKYLETHDPSDPQQQVHDQVTYFANGVIRYIQQVYHAQHEEALRVQNLLRRMTREEEESERAYAQIELPTGLDWGNLE